MSDDITDVHQSKMDPNDPSLTAPRKKTRALKQKPIMVGVAIVGLIMIAAVMNGLKPDNNAGAGQEQKVATSTDPMIPDSIRLNKGNATPLAVPAAPKVVKAPATPDYVPPLGRPMPGDLAYAVTTPATKPAAGASNRQSRFDIPDAPAVNVLSEEEIERRREYQRAMSGGVFFASGSSDGGSSDATNTANEATQRLLDQYDSVVSGQSNGGGGGSLFGSGAGIESEANFGNDSNLQSRKNAFLQGQGSRADGYLKQPLTQAVSPYEVKAGTFIPVSLITGINTDLPGEIIGQVRENVFDTVTGNHLLIPQGSRLMATYDSAVVYGQDRVLVCWNRLIRPDGSSMTLECMPGTDLEGYSGFADRVNNHWGRIAGGILLSSVLAVSTTRSQGQAAGDQATIDQGLAGNAADNINDIGQQITERNLEIQPTITIRPGFSVNVLVNKDMIMTPYALGAGQSELARGY